MIDELVLSPNRLSYCLKIFASLAMQSNTLLRSAIGVLVALLFIVSLLFLEKKEVGPKRFELLTFRLSAGRSSQAKLWALFAIDFWPIATPAIRPARVRMDPPALNYGFSQANPLFDLNVII